MSWNRLLTAAAVMCLSLCVCGTAEAQRLSAPPSSVTITATGLIGGTGAGSNHNGTWTLTTPVPYGSGQNDSHVTWVYTFMTYPGEPWRSPVIWGISIDHLNQITVSTGGQFPHVFTAVADPYTIGVIQAGASQVQITCNP